MADFKAAKVVAAVPTPPEPDTVYFVRSGSGFDIYVTNGVGQTTIYALNAAADAREWSADTVPQAEAEAGTATTRRAWSSLRVRQAITAWWSSLGTAFGRGFISLAGAAAGRSKLELGTAATMDVGTGSGNVMQVGAFGLGGPDDSPNGGVDVSTILGNRIKNFPSHRSYRNSTNTPTTENTGAALLNISDNDAGGNLFQLMALNDAGKMFFRVRDYKGIIRGWYELHHRGNILSTTGQSTQYPMTQKAVTDAIANIDVSGPRPIKDHGAVATAGSQTVVCNVQESDFHIMSMATASATGTLTIDFANMPDTVGKHFSWHVRLRRGGRKGVNFAQTISWAGGSKPSFGNTADSYDIIMFYKVGNETIRGMVVDVY